MAEGNIIRVGCGAIILNDKNEVLLLQRSANSRWKPSTWARPGGEVEFGETIEEALKREIKEEVGVEIKVIRQLSFHQNIDEGKKMHWLSFGFLAKCVSGSVKNCEPDKHDELKWFSLNDLPTPLDNLTKESIEDYFISKNK